MKDQFDVQLGVARPVDPACAARSEGAPEPAAEDQPEPVVVVEYRNRGLPVYLVPPLLIVLAALGIMSYQNVAASLPLRPVVKSTPLERNNATQTGTGAVAVDEKVETAHVLVVQKPDERASAPRRPPIPESAKPAIEVVETSAAKPAAPVVPPTPKPIMGPQTLFEHETVAGLRPVGAAAPEPPLVAPPPKP